MLQSAVSQHLLGTSWYLRSVLWADLPLESFLDLMDALHQAVVLLDGALP